MNIPSLAGLRGAAVAVAVIGLIAGSAGTVAAGSFPGASSAVGALDRLHGRFAEFEAFDCHALDADRTACRDQLISVFVGRMTDAETGRTHVNEVCVGTGTSVYSATADDFVGATTWDYGCRTDIPRSLLRIDQRLRSATLAPTVVRTRLLICDELTCRTGRSRNVIVRAAWSGFGPLSTTAWREGFRDDVCRASDSFRGSLRAATAVGSIGGRAVTGERSSAITSGDSKHRSSCPEF